jgi:hypothetical protein
MQGGITENVGGTESIVGSMICPPPGDGTARSVPLQVRVKENKEWNSERSAIFLP